MNWKIILNGKRNKSLVLISVLLLIVMIGVMNKKHISELKNSISAIYEDRLVAKGYIFDLSKTIHKKKDILNAEKDSIKENLIANHSINELIKDYEKTKLTLEENALLIKLKNDISLSLEFENQILHNQALPQREVVRNSLFYQYDLILDDLEELSKIQLYEGKKLLESSNEVLTYNNITGQLEIALLVVVALIFLTTMSANKSAMKKDLWHA